MFLCTLGSFGSCSLGGICISMEYTLCISKSQESGLKNIQDGGCVGGGTELQRETGPHSTTCSPFRPPPTQRQALLADVGGDARGLTLPDFRLTLRGFASVPATASCVLSLLPWPMLFPCESLPAVCPQPLNVSAPPYRTSLSYTPRCAIQSVLAGSLSLSTVTVSSF